MKEFVSKMEIKIQFSPSYSPWPNGLNKQNHYSADKSVRKLLDGNKEMSLQEIFRREFWTHNTKVMLSGYYPFTLMTGKSVVPPKYLQEMWLQNQCMKMKQ